MKKIILCFIFVLICSFISAETFEYTPNFPKIYTAREVAIVDNYVADTSTYFSVWSNPANAGLTGNKIMLPFVSLDMYSDYEKSIPLILSSLDSSAEGIAEYLQQNETSPLSMNVTGPLCLGAVQNNFFWGIFNNTYTNIDVQDIDTGNVTGGEQTILLAGYAYPIKLPFKTVISFGLSAKGFLDFQGSRENQLNQALSELKEINLSNFPIYNTFGFGFDTGITISVFDIVVISASWNNFFAASYTTKYNTLLDFKSFASNYDVKTTMPLEDNLILGTAIKFPLDNVSKGFISKFEGYVNCSHLLTLFEPSQQEKNYMEFFTFGSEIEFLSTISLRAGLNSEHLAFGAGLKMGAVKLDLGIYSKAWGLSKVDTKEMGLSFSLGTYK